MASVQYEAGFSGPATINHGDPVTITGTGFGTKSVAAPLVWDDASGPDDVRDLWTEAHPNHSVNTGDRNFRRRDVHRGVQPPHNRVGRYLTGLHNLFGEQYNAFKGPNVHVWRRFAVTLPQDQYASCWMRADPNWVFSSTGDNNFKCYTWALGTGTDWVPYRTANSGGVHINWNYPGGHPPTALNDPPTQYQLYSSASGTDPALGTMLDTNGENFPQGHVRYGVGPGTPYVHPMLGWNKYEFVNRFGSDAQGGSILIYENGRLIYRYTGHTDTDPSGFRLWSFGGFARNYWSSNNWRYYTDLYLDTTHARVMLLSPGAFRSDTIGVLDGVASVREVQVPVSWSDTSIHFIANLGALASTDTSNLYVVTLSNNPIKVATLTEGVSQDEPPVIVSSLSVSGEVGGVCDYQIQALNAPTSFGGSPLPSGTTFNSGTGQFGGTYSAPGQISTQISAANAFGSDQETVVFNIASPPDPAGIPVNIDSKPNKTGTTIALTVGSSGVPSGSTIYVAVATGGGSTTTGLPSVSDPINGGYSLDFLHMSGSGLTKLALFRLRNSLSLGQGQVITVSIGNGVEASKAATAFYLPGTWILDQTTGVAAAAESTTPDSGLISVSSDAKLVLGALSVAFDFEADGGASGLPTQDPDFDSVVAGANTTGGTDRLILVGNRILA